MKVEVKKAEEIIEVELKEQVIQDRVVEMKEVVVVQNHQIIFGTDRGVEEQIFQELVQDMQNKDLGTIMKVQTILECTMTIEVEIIMTTMNLETIEINMNNGIEHLSGESIMCQHM